MDSQTNNPIDLVFGIDLLRETIIGFAIHDNGGGFSARNALSCRSVQRSWMDSVFKCLVKFAEPLVIIELPFIRLFESGVESLLEIYEPSSRLSIKLTVRFENFAGQVNLELLKECLNLFGSGIVELKLEFVLNKTFLHKIKTSIRNFAQLSLTFPVLQKLTYSVDVNVPLSDTNGIYIDTHIISVSQSILSGCLRLKYFKFIGGINKPLPARFDNLMLPVTITNLVLDSTLDTTHLEPLMQNNTFVNLTNLTVRVPDYHSEEQWLYAILNRVSGTVKNLNIFGQFYSREEEVYITRVDPPLMKYLERIFIRAKNFEWADGVTDLQHKFPALTKIDLQPVTLTGLKKWAENSNFGSLKEVIVFFDTCAPFEELEFLTLDHAQLISEAFYKVTKLSINTACLGSVNQALQYLFMSMTQLQVLIIKLRATKSNHATGRYLDALLLGTTSEMIETLREEITAPEQLWEAVQLRMDKHFSVFNLPELRELSLDFVTESKKIYVSNRVKELVLSTMPNLQKINVPLRPMPVQTNPDFDEWNDEYDEIV